ncbi:cytidine and deoxycytidylate deaminase zinc-binding domain protein [Halenospora varia]|nr:cytidine and deoxycytidylate deaminase zinc-binding domain protein [Halenospora varia]
MALTQAELDLITAANRAIDAVPRGIEEHTVGSAVLTSSGKIYTGINVFHFTGGPCAENVAFANAAAAGVQSLATPPSLQVLDPEIATTVVAVTNDSRGVISPCGRCRQIMFDYYPDIKVIVRDPALGNDEEGLRTVTVGELLPFAYVSILRPVVGEGGGPGEGSESVGKMGISGKVL